MPLENSARQWVQRLAAFSLAAGWFVSCWFLLRPDDVVIDFSGWRQADTQTIAEYLSEPGACLFWPRIRWGGDGPGYVETELQLYAWLAAGLMRAFGSGVWAGQLLSWLSVGTALVLLFYHLRQYGELPAMLGVLAVLGARSVPYAATSVQPEGLCLLLYVAAWMHWVRYVHTRQSWWLVGFAVFGSLAMLVKPTAAQIGISSGVLLLLSARELIKRWQVWVAWATMLCLLGIHLAWARQLYLDYGNTFGVLSGGDSKLPHLDHLFVPGAYLRLLSNVVVWGTGLVAFVCASVLLVLRRLPATCWSLLIGNLVWVLLALRYTTHESWGVHYFVLLPLFAAECVACTVAILAPRRRWMAPGVAALVLVGTLHAARARQLGSLPDSESLAVRAVGRSLKEHAALEALVVVRSSIYAYDEYWRTPNNYEDPRIFYVSKTRGWVLASDRLDPASLSSPVKRGAAWYAEPRATTNAALSQWLAEHAQLVVTTEFGGRLFRLRPEAGAR